MFIFVRLRFIRAILFNVFILLVERSLVSVLYNTEILLRLFYFYLASPWKIKAAKKTKLHYNILKCEIKEEFLSVSKFTMKIPLKMKDKARLRFSSDEAATESLPAIQLTNAKEWANEASNSIRIHLLHIVAFSAIFDI